MLQSKVHEKKFVISHGAVKWQREMYRWVWQVPKAKRIERTGKTSASTVKLHVVLFTYIMHLQVMMAFRTVALELVR